MHVHVCKAWRSSHNGLKLCGQTESVSGVTGRLRESLYFVPRCFLLCVFGPSWAGTAFLPSAQKWLFQSLSILRQ